MKFDLRNNAFFVLGVTPQATKAEIAEAFKEAVIKVPEKEHEFERAKNALIVPKIRLFEELKYLWGVPLDDWEILLIDTPASWTGLSIIAKMNVAAHYCSLQAKNTEGVQQALSALITGKDAYSELFKEIKVNRKKAQMPLPQISQYEETKAAVSVQHRQAAMYAMNQIDCGEKLMAKIVGAWRYKKTEAGSFVMELGSAYDKWTIDKLHPVEKSINQVIKALRVDSESDNLSRNKYIKYIEAKISIRLDELESLLLEWHKFSQPVQLMYEAKGLDDPRSKIILNKLKNLYQDFGFSLNMPTQALRIALSLLEAFAELPGYKGQITSDVKKFKAQLK